MFGLKRRSSASAGMDRTQPSAPVRASQERGFGLAAFARALWQRRMWVVGPTGFALLASLAAVSLIAPVYTSTTQIMVEAREAPAADPMGEVMQALLSRDLARQVVASLDLAKRSSFDSAPADVSALGLIRQAIGGAPDLPRNAEDRALAVLAQRLTVARIEGSRLLALSVESSDPDLAARVANATADALVARRQAQRAARAKDADARVETEIGQLRARAAEAEGRLEAFRARAGLLAGPAASQLAAQQLADLNAQLAAARAQKAEAESKAKVARDMMRSGQIVETSEMLNAELVRRLAEQRVALRAQLSEQLSTLLEQHPRIKELRASIAGLDAQIHTEIDRLVRTYEGDARVAGTRLDALLASLDQLKVQAAGAGGDDAQLRALERDAKAAQERLAARLARQRDSEPADIRIVTPAVAAATASFPDGSATIAYVTLFAFVLSLLVVVLRVRKLARRVGFARAPEQTLDMVPDAPPLAPTLPSVEGAKGGAAEAGPTCDELVRSHAATTIALVPAHLGVDGHAEALRIARDLVAAGTRTLLIEFEPPRHPPADWFSDATLGLADLASGAAGFGDIIHRDPRSSLHVVPFGDPTIPAAEVIGDQRTALALTALARQYDRVILVTPPADALSVISHVPAMPLLIVLAPSEWTPAEAAAAYDSLSLLAASEVLAVRLPPNPERELLQINRSKMRAAVAAARRAA